MNRMNIYFLLFLTIIRDAQLSDFPTQGRSFVVGPGLLIC